MVFADGIPARALFSRNILLVQRFWKSLNCYFKEKRQFSEKRIPSAKHKIPSPTLKTRAPAQQPWVTFRTLRCHGLHTFGQHGNSRLSACWARCGCWSTGCSRTLTRPPGGKQPQSCWVKPSKNEGMGRWQTLNDLPPRCYGFSN